MKKHKFTWIDALILIVVLLLVAGTCVKFLANDTTAGTQQTVEFEYKVKISGVRQFTVDALQEGDTIYESEGKGQVGVISGISTAPAETTYTDPTGVIYETTVEGKFDVILTITAQGTPYGNVYKVGTYDIKANKNSEYFTKYSTWSGTIVEID